MATTQPSYTGDATSLVPLSGTQLTDSLINGSKWGTGAAGSGAALTYAFPTTVTAFDTTAGVPGNYGETDPLELGLSAYLAGFSAFSTDQQQATRTILQAFANVANLSFTEITADSVNAGTLRFANSAPPGLGETTYGASWFAQDFAGAGDTWMNSAFSFPEGWAPGTQNFLTLLHETGHAIGLKHPHDTGSASDFGISTPVVLPFTGTDTLTEASTQTMVMAYNDIPGIGDLDGLSLQSDFAPTTPMRADIAALQYLYGANVSYNAGDTVYTFREDSRYNETLWDAGGNDTIVATGTRDAFINLQSGSWSKLGTPITFSTRNADLSVAAVQSQFTNPFTVYIYDTVTIENAVGGAGNDTLTGNAQANRLQGLSGNDTLTGGAGTDTAVYTSTATSYQLGFGTGELTLQDRSGTDGTDTLSNIELLQFADRLVHVESRAPTLVYTDLPQELYHFFIVAFGATPGVTYMDQLAEAYRYFEPQMGKNDAIQNIVNIFTTKSQYLNLYPDISTLQDRTNLVQDIVKSSASAAAKAAAVQDIGDALAAGWSVGKVIYTVFGNLANKPQDDATWGGTAKQFANELAVARYYTETLNQSTDNVDTLRSVIKLVGADSDVSTNAAIVELIGVGLLQA